MTDEMVRIMRGNLHRHRSAYERRLCELIAMMPMAKSAHMTEAIRIQGALEAIVSIENELTAEALPREGGTDE